MSDTLYEYFETYDTFTQYYGNIWGAQTFTLGTVGTNTAHTITSVKIKLYRVGNPGTITVSIKDITTGLPSGADLCSGTLDGNSLTTNTAGEVKEITLGAGTILSASTQYAIVVKATAGDASNYFMWAISNSGGYAGGRLCESANGGSTWTGYNGNDLFFDEYGIPTAINLSLTLPTGYINILSTNFVETVVSNWNNMVKSATATFNNLTSHTGAKTNKTKSTTATFKNTKKS